MSLSIKISISGTASLKLVLTSLVPSTDSIICLKSSDISSNTSKSSPFIPILIGVLNPITSILEVSLTKISAPGISLTKVLISSATSAVLLFLSFNLTNLTEIVPLSLPELPPIKMSPAPTLVNITSISLIAVNFSSTTLANLSTFSIFVPKGIFISIDIVPSSIVGKNSIATPNRLAILKVNIITETVTVAFLRSRLIDNNFLYKFSTLLNALSKIL